MLQWLMCTSPSLQMLSAWGLWSDQQRGEGWTVCSGTDVCSLCAFVIWALIWSVKGMREYRKQRGEGWRCMGTPAVWRHPPQIHTQAPPRPIHTHAKLPNGTHCNWLRIRAHGVLLNLWIMHYAWICWDYTVLGYYASIFSDCLCVISLC